jgi:hypothetical protein
MQTLDQPSPQPMSSTRPVSALNRAETSGMAANQDATQPIDGVRIKQYLSVLAGQRKSPMAVLPVAGCLEHLGRGLLFEPLAYQPLVGRGSPC